MRFGSFIACILPLVLFSIPVQSADEVPKQYTLDYPVVTRTVPPVRSTFVEVTRTTERIGNRVIRHPLNGGYGVKLDHPSPRPMIHLGADLGWRRVGEPVFAVAEGVVRVSNPSIRAAAKSAGKKLPKLPAGTMMWGNIVIIEHKLKNGAYVTTLYGHLGDDRRVKAGDIVQPGQQIGTIGRQSVYVNGGYIPHLHFGVCYGRLLEKGRTLFTVPWGAKLLPVNVVDFTPDRVQLDFGEAAPRATEYQHPSGGRKWSVTREGGKLYMPARMLWTLTTRAFPYVGYGDSTKGYLDPIAFLRKPEAVQPGRPSGNNLTKPIVLKVYDVLGKPAPAWGVERWDNLPDDQKSLDAGDFKGNTVAIFCFQSSCPVCRKTGFTVWKKLIDHYRNNSDVKFVAVQVANKKFSRNRFSHARSIGRRYRWKVPVGHQGDERNRPMLMQRYGVNTTPWMIVIDAHGLVRMNVMMPNLPSCIKLIERTRQLGQLPAPKSKKPAKNEPATPNT